MNHHQSFSTVSPLSGDPGDISIGEDLGNLGKDGEREADFEALIQRNEQGVQQLYPPERDYELSTDIASRDELNNQQNISTNLQQANFQEWTSLEAGRSIDRGSDPSATLLDDPIINLLDSDDDDEGAASDDTDILLHQRAASKLLKRKLPSDGSLSGKRSLSGGEASYLARSEKMPSWMQLNGHTHPPSHLNNLQTHDSLHAMYDTITPQQHPFWFTEPQYISQSSDYIPTWKALQSFEATAIVGTLQYQAAYKHYELSLLNVSEFTVNGGTTSSQSGYESTSLAGLRVHIKSIAREHGKAVFERDVGTNEGKWRIPLGAYRDFLSFLSAQPNTTVTGIDEIQLKIASLGKARIEKDYPSGNDLVQLGIPNDIAHTLAPFQRGGVEFVYEKGGRALIADEMGLGKTIQGIASMALYHDEWPVLVLCPSGARYHWQTEFVNWLGDRKKFAMKLPMGLEDGDQENIDGNNVPPPSLPRQNRPRMEPLTQRQVHVLTYGKETVLPDSDTKVVICSYGLAQSMIKNMSIYPGLFLCAIVDESHMLKNKKSQRTQQLLPVLQATKRCVLLSGTPALARPIELWPQLVILGTAKNGWDIDEAEFIQKYVKSSSTQRRAELHTMLTGTIMIRRMKSDILKSLPAKVREQAIVGVIDESQRKEFQQCIEMLREGKGALGKIANSTRSLKDTIESLEDKSSSVERNPSPPRSPIPVPTRVSPEDQANFEMQEMYHQQSSQLKEDMTVHRDHFETIHMQSSAPESDQDLQHRCRAFYTDRLNRLLEEEAATGPNVVPKPMVPTRKSVLMYMFKMTGQVKIPLIVEMLKKWIDNPAKGKLCLFAHHISVLNEIERLTGLSNTAESTSHFIRIDGSTGPKVRQEHINKFQNDPKVRVALLGITAAGVAVTLTASSTVWFAELFWTPALMIQAEDRCHRIGQQAKVRCLYIVAKGTLDEILWKHVEKKFQNLGEFVEGKEKLRMVVHKTYKGTEEWRKSLDRSSDEDDDDDSDDCDEPKFMIDDEGVDEGIINEIHQLEEEEQAMLKASEVDDDDLEGEPKGCAPLESRKNVAVVGSSEADAICLSDDEEERSCSTVIHDGHAQQNPPPKPSIKEILMSRSFPSLRFYKMHFSGDNFGLDIVAYNGRIVVYGQSDKRIKQFGLLAKPAPGDILIACDNKYIPYGWDLNNALGFLASTIKASPSPVELIFAEDSGFTIFFAENPPVPEKLTSPFSRRSSVDFDTMLRDSQDFDCNFDGPSLELGIRQFEGFSVIASSEHSIEGGGPRVGDILLAVNGQFFPRGVPLQDTLAKVVEKLKFPPITITFRRSELFSIFFTMRQKKIKEEIQVLSRPHVVSQIQQHQRNEGNGAGVIDLLD